MPKLSFINAVPQVRLNAKTELVRNTLNSLLLIAECNDYPGIHPFITQTHASLDYSVRQTNKIIMIGLHHAALPEKDFPSFQHYIDDLKKTDPQILQDRVFYYYDMISGYKVNIISENSPVTITPKDQKRLLSSKEIYLEYLEACFGNETLDHLLEGRAYDYLIRPRELRDYLVEHFQYMWDHYLKEEFNKNHIILENAVCEFNRINLSAMSPFEIVRKITGHDIEIEWANNPGELEWIEKSKQVVFTPSLHMGPYLGRRLKENVVYIFFSPRIIEGIEFSSPDLTRTDISMRLNTLCDDVRLKILKLVSQTQEISSKQIMENLQLTQSSASRHLKQLSATGFLNEHRQNSAKIYSLNSAFVSQTMNAISTYLLGD